MAEHESTFISPEEYDIIYKENNGFVPPQSPNHPATSESVYDLVAKGSDAIVKSILGE
jgi:hypothetical protein